MRKHIDLMLPSRKSEFDYQGKMLYKILHRYGRDIPLPFSLNYFRYRMWCKEMLRIIPHRRFVARGIYDYDHVVIKVFFDKKRSFIHWRREQKKYYALKKAGILMPRLRQMGMVSKRYKICAFVFDYLEPQIDIYRYLKLRGKSFDFVVERLLELFIELHEKGFCQTDLHLGNFICHKDKIYLIDCACVEQKEEPLSRQEAIDNLIDFCAQSFSFDLSLLEIFYERYLLMRNWPQCSEEEKYVYDLFNEKSEKEKKLCLEKCLKDCTDVIKKRSFFRASAFKRNLMSKKIKAFIKNPDDFMKKGEILKAGNTCTVVKTTINKKEMVIKRYNIKSFSHRLKKMWRNIRAKKSWIDTHRLRFCSILTPRAYGFLEKRVGFFYKETYFVSEYIEGQTLDTFFETVDDKALREVVVKRLATIFSRLKRHFIFHGDTKPQNFLVTSDGRVYILDLDALKQYDESTYKKKQCAQKDRERFLKDFKKDQKLYALLLSAIFE